MNIISGMKTNSERSGERERGGEGRRRGEKKKESNRTETRSKRRRGCASYKRATGLVEKNGVDFRDSKKTMEPITARNEI